MSGQGGAGLRIGIDGRYQGQPVSGMPRYIDGLCRALDELLPEAQFFLYAVKPDGIRLPSARWTLRTETQPRYAKLKPNPWWWFRAHRLIAEDALDVLWATAHFLPRPVAGVRYCLTIHDLTCKLYPQTMKRANRLAHALLFDRHVRRADTVFTVSQGTRERLEGMTGRRAEAVVSPDAGAQFQPADAVAQAAVRARHGLARPYLLAVSTLEPRKNFGSLVEAFVALKRAGELREHELILIGRTLWRGDAIGQALAAAEPWGVRCLGHVADADLPALYSASALFCMPSLYEGFGIPVREARRCGARVLTTDIPELREAGDERCVYVAPTPAAIADGIRCALAAPEPGVYCGPASSWLKQAQRMLPFLLRSSDPGLPP
ncbi:MAG: glycosyltransferase family 1 protein [Nevskia sp.]